MKYKITLFSKDFRITAGLGLAIAMTLLTTGCMVRTTTARAVTGRVVDIQGKPIARANVRIESPELQEPKEVLSGPDGWFEYGGRAPWGLYAIGDLVETPLTVTASDKGRTAPPKQVGGGVAQRRLFGVGGMRSSDVGVIVIVDPAR